MPVDLNHPAFNEFPDEPDFEPRQSGFVNVKDLPPGIYDFVIADVNLRDHGGVAIVNLRLRVGGSVQLYDWDHWTSSQQECERLAAVLVSLGFPFKRPFGAWLKATLPRLVNVQFKGHRSDSPKKDEPGKFWQNLLVLSRKEAGAPAQPAAAPAPAPRTSAPSRRPAPAAAGQDVPF